MSNETLITIRLPKTRQLQEDVFVSVNHRTWLIQRGVPVQVPECVAEVIRHQEEMLEQILVFENQNQSR